MRRGGLLDAALIGDWPLVHPLRPLGKDWSLKKQHFSMVCNPTGGSEQNMVGNVSSGKGSEPKLRIGNFTDHFSFLWLKTPQYPAMSWESKARAFLLIFESLVADNPCR